MTSPLELITAAIAAWLVIGGAGIVQPRNLRVVRLLFIVGAVVAIGVAAVGLIALRGDPETIVLALGLPDLPFHLRVDALSAFFLILLGAATAAISLFSSGYFRAG